jgi:hypothetical protein
LPVLASEKSDLIEGSMSDYDTLLNDLLRESAEGYVELWSVIWMVRYALNENNYPEQDRSDPKDVRIATMDLVRRLLSSGKVQVGNLSTDGTAFEAWPLTVNESILRINAAWDSLGHEPNMEESVAIFTSRKG